MLNFLIKLLLFINIVDTENDKNMTFINYINEKKWENLSKEIIDYFSLPNDIIKPLFHQEKSNFNFIKL